MQINYDSGKAGKLAFAMLVTAVVGVAFLAWAISLDLEGIPEAAMRGAGVGLMVVGLLQGWIFYNMSKRSEPIVTIDGAGIAFHLKDFPAFTWDQVARAEVARIANADQLAVSLREPAPKLGVLAALRQAVNRRRKDGLMRYAIPVSRLAATTAEIEAALAEHRPGDS